MSDQPVCNRLLSDSLGFEGSSSPSSLLELKSMSGDGTGAIFLAPSSRLLAGRRLQEVHAAVLRRFFQVHAGRPGRLAGRKGPASQVTFWVLRLLQQGGLGLWGIGVDAARGTLGGWGDLGPCSLSRGNTRSPAGYLKAASSSSRIMTTYTGIQQCASVAPLNHLLIAGRRLPKVHGLLQVHPGRSGRLAGRKQMR